MSALPSVRVHATCRGASIGRGGLCCAHVCSKLDDAISRGMDNLGRVYQKMGRFDTAARMYVARMRIISARIFNLID